MGMAMAVVYLIFGVILYIAFWLDGTNIYSHRGIPIYANPIIVIFVSAAALIILYREEK